MKILIVDDENQKAEKIKNMIIGDTVIDEANVDVVPSINDAVKKMIEDKYQLMILDMCLPNSYGSKTEEDGGLQLINILNQDKRIISPSDIIVLTSHNELVEKYKKDIAQESFEIINYDDSSEEWKTKLIDKIKYLVRCEESPQKSREYNFDVAIITAVPVENEAVKKLSNEWERKKIEGDSTVYNITKWNNGRKDIKIVTTSLTQMGMVSAATITTKLIYNFTPRYIIMTGIAGGVKSEYEFGDVIIPKEVKDYCSGKYTTPAGEKQDDIDNPLKYFVPTASSIITNFDIINMVSDSMEHELKRIHDEWPGNCKYRIPQIRTGYMASGDSVVQNGAVIDMLIKNHLRQADALDMEAYGMYYASQQAVNPKPIPICMKAISDFANKEKSDEHQSYAAYTSAQFAKYFVLKVLNL